MGRYDQMIADAAERHNLPPGVLSAQMQAESGGDPNAVSPVGAQGLMQLMPGTAKDLGVTDSFDPGQNINGGAKYLRQQLDRFGGDMSKALAAYNYGPANVAAGKPLPTETQNYVSKILGNQDPGDPPAGGMPSIQDVISNPAFQGLPSAEKLKVLDRISPQFAALPGQEKTRAVDMLDTRTGQDATGLINGPDVLRTRLGDQGIKTSVPIAPPTTPESDELWRSYVRGWVKGPVNLAEGATDFFKKSLEVMGFIDEIDPRNMSQLITGEHPEKASWAASVIGGLEQATGVALPEPKSMGARAAERVGEEHALTLATALPIGKAMKMMGVLSNISPARLAMLQTVLSTGGGITASVFRDTIFRATPELGDFLGEMIGSLGMNTVLGAVNWTLKKFAGDAAKETARKTAVGKELLNATSGDTAGVDKAVTALQDVQTEIGLNPDGSQKFKGTTGGAARDEPGIRNLQQGFSQTGGGRTVGADSEFGAAAVSGRFEKRGKQDLTAINERLNEVAPAGDVRKVGEELNQQQQAATAGRLAGPQQTLATLEAQKTAAQAQVTAQTNMVVHNTEQMMGHAETRAGQRALALGQTGLTNQQRGAILRKEYQEELKASENAVTALYNRVDMTIKVPMSHTLDAAKEVTQGIRTAEASDLIPSGVLADIKTLGPPQPKPNSGLNLRGGIQPATPTAPHEVEFGELDALKKRIQQEGRKAVRDGNGRLAGRLKQLELGLQQDVDALADNPALAARYPQQAANYQDARTLAYKEIMRLKSGTSDRLRYKDVTGRWEENEQDLPDLFLKGKASIDDLVNAVGSRPAAMDAVREHLRLNMLDKTIDLTTDRIDPVKWKRWLQDRDNQAVLAQFPELRAEFEDAASATRYAKSAREQVTAMNKDRDAYARQTDPTLFNRLDAVDQQVAAAKEIFDKAKSQKQIDVASDWMGVDADRAAYQVIASAKTRRTEVATMLGKLQGNPEALAGFQRAMWDASVSKWMSQAAVDGAGDPALMANKMRMFLRGNRDWMTDVFGPDRMASLDKLEKGLEIVQNAKYTNSATPRLLNTQADIAAAGPLLSKMFYSPSSMILAFGKVGYMALQRHLSALDNEQVAALFQEAFFDPKVAQTLMLMAKPGTSEPLINKRLYAHLFNMNQLYDYQEHEDNVKERKK